MQTLFNSVNGIQCINHVWILKSYGEFMDGKLLSTVVEGGPWEVLKVDKMAGKLWRMLCLEFIWPWR